MEVKNKKILLIDDDVPLITMLKTLLNKEGYSSVCAITNGVEAIKIAEEWKPDLIILDIMMPDISGYNVCEEIRKTSMVPILFLSAKQEEEDVLKSFSLGGDNFISKPFNSKELIARIRAMLTRIMYYEKNLDTMSKESNIIRFGEFVLDINRKELFKGTEVVELTHKEYLLLEYLVVNKNITLSKEQIILNVWESTYDGYENTISVHIRHLREKIEDFPSNSKYIKTVKGIGYRFELANM